MPISAPDTAGAPACTTVYFDGACPLCSVEIDYYRCQAGAEALQFVDVSGDPVTGCSDLTRDDALKRFHIRRPDGTLVSGAAAFVGIWRLLPGWAWAARLASVPGMLVVLEVFYRLFLTFRPLLARLLKMLGLARPTKIP